MFSWTDLLLILNSMILHVRNFFVTLPKAYINDKSKKWFGFIDIIILFFYLVYDVAYVLYPEKITCFLYITIVLSFLLRMKMMVYLILYVHVLDGNKMTCSLFWQWWSSSPRFWFLFLPFPNLSESSKILENFNTKKLTSKHKKLILTK